MKPDAWMQPNGPRTLSDFAIDWPNVAKEIAPYAEADLRYLATTAEFCNNGGMPDGIVAVHAELTSTDELLRAFHFAHHLQNVSASLAAHLLARTSFAAALARFDADAERLFARIEEAKFEPLSPFLLEGTLAQDLYHYADAANGVGVAVVGFP